MGKGGSRFAKSGSSSRVCDESNDWQPRRYSVAPIRADHGFWNRSLLLHLFASIGDLEPCASETYFPGISSFIRSLYDLFSASKPSSAF